MLIKLGVPRRFQPAMHTVFHEESEAEVQHIQILQENLTIVVVFASFETVLGQCYDMFGCLSLCLSVRLSLCLSVSRSLYVSLSVHLSVSLSLRLSVVLTLVSSKVLKAKALKTAYR